MNAVDPRKTLVGKEIPSVIAPKKNGVYILNCFLHMTVNSNVFCGCRQNSLFLDSWLLAWFND